MTEMSRRRARELALQVLYQLDVGAKVEPDEALSMTVEVLGLENQGDPGFARELVSGVLLYGQQLDQVISGLSKEWRLERISYVDRNIMRIGLYELLFNSDVPHNVAVNEAVELAKKFGTDESGRFVNGILGRVVENPELYVHSPDGKVQQ